VLYPQNWLGHTETQVELAESRKLGELQELQEVAPLKTQENMDDK